MSDSRSAIKAARLAFLLIGVLLGGRAALALHVELPFYVAVLLVGALYVSRRPSEALWVGFYLLSVTSQVYPIEVDEVGVSLQGAHRPYILVLGILAAATLVALTLRTSRRCEQLAPWETSVRLPILAFVCVLFLALAHGYFSSAKSATLSEVIRDCSGWMTLVFFMALGHRLSTSLNEINVAFARLRLAVLIYSSIFIVEYLRVWASAGPLPASLFGNSQRDPVFFSGVTLAVLVTQALAPGVKSADRKGWFPPAVLLAAILLCGSRSMLGSVVLVGLLFLSVWHARTWLRMGLLGAACGLVVLLALSVNPSSLFDSKESLLGSLTSRFLSSPMEDTSFLARASEMAAIAAALRENPLLGRGPLASYSFFDPVYGWLDVTFVDSGVGYLLMKTGVLGTGVFLWFVVAWLRMAKRLHKLVPTSAIPLLATFIFYVAFLPFGPSFFEFQHAWFIGLIVGQAVRMASGLPSAQRSRVHGVLYRREVVA